jgi:hypothetical protein
VAAHQFLKQLDEFMLMENEVGVIPVGILNQETVSVDYYSSTAVSLRHAPVAVRQMCRTFAAHHLSLPPPPPPDPEQLIGAWQGCGIPREHIFRLTDPATEDMRLPDNFPPLRAGMKILLVGKMGSGKTNMVSQLRHRPNLVSEKFLYVCALRSLAKAASEKFGIPHHLVSDDNGQGERVRSDLITLPRLCVVMNSLSQLQSQQFGLLFWDEFRQDLLSLLSDNLAQKVLPVWNTMCSLFHSEPEGEQRRRNGEAVTSQVR